MKSKTWVFLAVLIALVSCGKDEATDRRSAFLGDWEYAYDLSCSPPGGTISDSETLEITKGDGSSKIVLTFNDSGLVLECSSYSENLFGVNSYLADGIAYTVTGSTYDDGTLDILITFSVGGSYCVQSGIASPL